MEDRFVFDSEFVRKIAQEEIEKILNQKKYDKSKNELLCAQISEAVLTKLSTVSNNPNQDQPPDSNSEFLSHFKFITHCFISPAETVSYDTYSNNFWNQKTDGMCVVDYQNNEIRFTLTIWGVHI